MFCNFLIVIRFAFVLGHLAFHVMRSPGLFLPPPGTVYTIGAVEFRKRVGVVEEIEISAAGLTFVFSSSQLSLINFVSAFGCVRCWFGTRHKSIYKVLLTITHFAISFFYNAYTHAHCLKMCIG